MKAIYPWLALGMGALAVPAMAQQGMDRANMAQRLLQADADGNGQVTRAEFLAHRGQQFARFDRNGDGYISMDDVPRLLSSRFEPRMKAMQQQFDANKDGKISRDEFINGPTMGFDMADGNHDNIVTRAEAQALSEKAKAARGG